jgi:hypothetical protein
MSQFDEDFKEFISHAEGFDDLPPDAQKGLRVVAFGMWCKGINRMNKATMTRTIPELLTDMVQDVISMKDEHPSERSKEQMQ